MKLLLENDITHVGIDWKQTINVVAEAVRCLNVEDFAQPLKPYLRYGNPKNRIIAMPAFVGGKFNVAGIKWIASFPGNIQKDIPRAHSVVILNEAETGVPVAAICTPLLSVIRTASVSGLLIDRFLAARSRNKINVGIIGFGPIGQYHLSMCQKLLGDKLKEVLIYDLRPIAPDRIPATAPVRVAGTWQEVYDTADIFITCTVSDAPYIDRKPKAGSLHLNVSLRDYKTIVTPWFEDCIIVDDWKEVCRENTDIERMHIANHLNESDTKSIIDVVVHNCVATYSQDKPIMFNPMGMAVFDIALAKFYYLACEQLNNQS
jgi:N-[(2S)-2-amino-2-carboxyethyl]-L-glutamate dehydrogenase